MRLAADEVVVAVVVQQLRDRITESAELVEIIAFARHRSLGAEQGHCRIGDRDFIRENLQPLIAHIAAALAGEVEVRMVGEA